MIVGRLLSFWEGNFSGAMLVLGRVCFSPIIHLLPMLKGQSHLTCQIERNIADSLGVLGRDKHGNLSFCLSYRGIWSANDVVNIYD